MHIKTRDSRQRAVFRMISALLMLFGFGTFSAGAHTPLASVDGPAGASPAWTIRPAILRPMPEMLDPKGPEIADKQAVWVLRCETIWCDIQAGPRRGWVELSALSFGQFPRGPFTGPKLMRKSGGPGQVCFYSGIHFSGARFCAETGYVARDLKLSPWNDRIRSIRITGQQSVLVCRERNYGSYCETVIGDRPVLPKLLRRAISSLHVY